MWVCDEVRSATKLVFEILVESGQILYMEAVCCTVLYLERSQSLRLFVIGSLLSRATLSQNNFVGGFGQFCGDVLVSFS